MTRRLNKPIAALYLAAAVGLGGVGYGGYTNWPVTETTENEKENENEKQSEQIRAAITEFLPLVREITNAAPAIEYPKADIPNMNGELPNAISMAEYIIEDKGRFQSDDITTRCNVLTYLRAVHRQATENYIESEPAFPLPNLQTHINTAKNYAPSTPSCKGT